jgi:hypothetical protein
MPISASGRLEQMVSRQVSRVLERGTRAERFDQLRSRHFWSSYLFIGDTTDNTIASGQYDIFKIIPSASGQGYPTNLPLTLRETNWLNGGRVPDNQNFVITEIGVTVKRPPAVDANGLAGIPANPPSNGIWSNLTVAQQAYITAGAQNRAVNPFDSMAMLYGTVLEMSFLTNNVPLGLCADFSQSAGVYSPHSFLGPAADVVPGQQSQMGDMSNGVPAAAFRRKLEVPILLQHGENMGMRLNIPRPISLVSPANGGTGWLELRVDWWAHESFVEKS